MSTLLLRKYCRAYGSVFLLCGVSSSLRGDLRVVLPSGGVEEREFVAVGKGTEGARRRLRELYNERGVPGGKEEGMRRVVEVIEKARREIVKGEDEDEEGGT